MKGGAAAAPAYLPREGRIRSRHPFQEAPVRNGRYGTYDAELSSSASRRSCGKRCAHRDTCMEGD